MDDRRFFLSDKSLEHDFNLLMTSLNTSPSSIILTDTRQPDSLIIFCNQAFENMTDYSHNAIGGRNNMFLQGNGRQQEDLHKPKDATAKGYTVMLELSNHRKNRIHFRNESHLSPIKNAKNQITRFIGVQNEISARKKIGSELHSKRELLEKRIRESTQHLRNS